MAVKSARPNDYIYDPLFTVSSEKDHYKVAMLARMSTAKFAICPIFPSMFSDLPNQPRNHIVMRKSAPPPPFKLGASPSNDSVGLDRFVSQPAVDVAGTDRHKFFHCPVINLPQYTVPSLSLYTTSPARSFRTSSSVKSSPKYKNQKIQTQYRESSAQTSPWEPDYTVVDESDPEILMLDFLKWGSGLPAGVHEVRLIERARMKRKWEQAMPAVETAEGLQNRRDVIAVMERDEWAFREQEIQDIQDLRLELLEKMLNELHEQSKCRTEKKMKMFCETKQAEKEEKIAKLRHNAERELRKLEMKQRGVNVKYHSVNIVDEHANKNSELYGPLMRHGEHPKRWHQIIDERMKKYRAQFIGVEAFSTLPRWLDEATKMKDCCCVKLPGTRLCMRETKWTTPVLKQLHYELKNLHKDTRRPCTLRVRIEHPESEPPTPEMDGVDDDEEELHQAAILIESILRGRASQMLLYEGRDRCRELIRELRTTHSLQEEEKDVQRQERLAAISQQRDEKVAVKKTARLQETLNRVSGKIIGSLLDFLNKELRRLMDERRLHAMCLVAERERQNREAAEAGRRQVEMRRRKEHDEIFKQIVKVQQDTVDLYLQDIITEGMDFASTEEAKEYVTKLAEKIDEETYESLTEGLEISEQQEMVADLVHHFVIPEVEKELVRTKIRNRQKNYLQTVHDTIYTKVETLRPNEDSQLPSTSGSAAAATQESRQAYIEGLKSFVIDDDETELEPPTQESENVEPTSRSNTYGSIDEDLDFVAFEEAMFREMQTYGMRKSVSECVGSDVMLSVASCFHITGEESTPEEEEQSQPDELE